MTLEEQQQQKQQKQRQAKTIEEQQQLDFFKVVFRELADLHPDHKVKHLTLINKLIGSKKPDETTKMYGRGEALDTLTKMFEQGWMVEVAGPGSDYGGGYYLEASQLEEGRRHHDN